MRSAAGLAGRAGPSARPQPGHGVAAAQRPAGQDRQPGRRAPAVAADGPGRPGGLRCPRPGRRPGAGRDRPRQHDRLRADGHRRPSGPPGPTRTPPCSTGSGSSPRPGCWAGSPTARPTTPRTWPGCCARPPRRERAGRHGGPPAHGARPRAGTASSTCSARAGWARSGGCGTPATSATSRPRCCATRARTRCCGSWPSRAPGSATPTCSPRSAGPRTTRACCSPWSWSTAGRSPTCWATTGRSRPPRSSS